MGSGGAGVYFDAETLVEWLQDVLAPQLPALLGLGAEPTLSQECCNAVREVYSCKEMTPDMSAGSSRALIPLEVHLPCAGVHELAGACRVQARRATRCRGKWGKHASKG